MRSGLEILQRSGRDVGWLYLAVVLDLYSRRVIGWAMAATQDEALIERAFQMALLARHPPAGVLFHSDRGSQDTSDASASRARECRCYGKYEPHWQLLRERSHRIVFRDT